jgi:hypothetical protein
MLFIVFTNKNWDESIELIGFFSFSLIETILSA